MTIFDVDFDRLIKRFVPSFLYTEPMVSWLVTLSKPIRTVYGVLSAFISATRLTLSYNSQTLIFETYLNDVFDPGPNRIYIDNTFSFAQKFFIFFEVENQTPDFIWFASEGQPVTYLNFNSEFANNFDFIVFVPASLVFDQNKMNQIIKNTKLAGKRYKIELF